MQRDLQITFEAIIIDGKTYILPDDNHYFRPVWNKESCVLIELEDKNLGEKQVEQ